MNDTFLLLVGVSDLDLVLPKNKKIFHMDAFFRYLALDYHFINQKVKKSRYIYPAACLVSEKGVEKIVEQEEESLLEEVS